METKETKPILSVKELARYLKVSPYSIYKLAREGKIPGFKVGNKLRFDLEAVLEALKKLGL
ncbi:MAG: helix-turn-helix domain-containing protein [Candidatus Omnitrophica bacterium]|nr:helix-turn-helix domain-containing protein [Candidatus Omnitrophota bacterium]